MNDTGFFGAIIIGIIAGWIAERLLNRHHGLLTNLAVGLVGGLIGEKLAGLFHIDFAGKLSSLVVSTIGAVLLLFLLGMVKKNKHIEAPPAPPAA